MREVHVVGAGGHGRVIFDLLRHLDPDCRVIWHDDAWETMQVVAPVEEIRSVDSLFTAPVNTECFVAIGRFEPRLSLIGRLLEHGHQVVTLIHPDASVSPFAEIGAGGVAMAGSVIQTGARLGAGVIVNTGATVDHDCRLGDGVHVAPGAHLAGDVLVGDRTMIGIGAVVREGIAIGSDVIVGAGAVVVEDLADGRTVVGNPARIMRNGR